MTTLSLPIKPLSAPEIIIVHKYNIRASKNTSIVLQEVNTFTHSRPRVQVANNVSQSTENNFYPDVTEYDDAVFSLPDVFNISPVYTTLQESLWSKKYNGKQMKLWTKMVISYNTAIYSKV